MISLRLGDIEILTESTPHVASCRAHGKNPGSREEMVQGLLLDRVHGNRGGPPIAELQETSAFVLADEAETGLTFGEVAMAWAEIAM